MKHAIKVFTFRIIISGLLVFGLLVVILLNPGLLYANKTIHTNYRIFHNKQIDKHLKSHLDKAKQLLAASELYDPNLIIDICLNDESFYSVINEKIHGQSFGSSFYNKIILHGNANYKNNHIELNGYRWNLTQLLAHEATHCLQFNELGLWKSNPIGKIPSWKNEGYPEYISRRNDDQVELSHNIDRLIENEKTHKNDWGITFEDGSSVSRQYYNYWLLVQYCMDIKKMTFRQILQDRTQEETLKQEMMTWYQLSTDRRDTDFSVPNASYLNKEPRAKNQD